MLLYTHIKPTDTHKVVLLLMMNDIVAQGVIKKSCVVVVV